MKSECNKIRIAAVESVFSLSGSARMKWERVRERKGPRCHLALTSGRINIHAHHFSRYVVCVAGHCVRVSLFAKRARYQRAAGLSVLWKLDCFICQAPRV